MWQKWGEELEWKENCHKEGKNIQEWLQDMSLYSAKINSKDYNFFMMLVNTEFCMALTDTVTWEGEGGRDRVRGLKKHDCI